MFNRTEMSELSGISPSALYTLEEKNIINSQKNKYTYNQLIFGRVLEQVRDELGVTALKFADDFGSRAQYDIDWTSTCLIMVVNQGFGIIDGEKNKEIESAFDEWFLPHEKEAFSIDGDSNPEIRKFLKDHFFIDLKGNANLIYVAIFRVRKAIERAAKKRLISDKLEIAKGSPFEYTLVR